MARNVNIEFRGGAELLFGGVHHHKLELPADSKGCWTIGKLLAYMRDNMLHDQPEMFLQGSSVRPGILVLVNNVDWELCGELSYEIIDNDNILFISTLHGG